MLATIKLQALPRAERRPDGLLLTWRGGDELLLAIDEAHGWRLLRVLGAALVRHAEEAMAAQAGEAPSPGMAVTAGEEGER